MTTPSDRDSGAERPGGEDLPGVDLGKSGGQEAPFDPYRFGKPDRPIPPEYAPPGYVPEPVPPVPPATPAGPGPGAPPYGSQPGPYGAQFPPPYPGGYGAAPPPYYTGYPPPAGNGKATAALVLGIVSILLSWFVFFDAIFIILGLIFGLLGLSASKRRQGAGRSLAVAGLACTAVGLVATIAFTVFAFHVAGKCGGFDNGNDPNFQTCIRDHV
ncbi:hypothetical protein [uncultured Jatrophihabitans sp.]|uniref:hypothetical protein n=1 Tax=uncultured Jatrophihabitans sp. TaxID=1610747 RepID=UPI0035CB7E00